MEFNTGDIVVTYTRCSNAVNYSFRVTFGEIYRISRIEEYPNNKVGLFVYHGDSEYGCQFATSLRLANQCERVKYLQGVKNIKDIKDLI